MKGKLAFTVFAAFWIVGAVLGVVAVIKKHALADGALRFGTLLYFGVFLICMSVVEIYVGEIRTSFRGPPLSSREGSPGQFWFQIVAQAVFGAILLAALFWKT